MLDEKILEKIKDDNLMIDGNCMFCQKAHGYPFFSCWHHSHSFTICGKCVSSKEHKKEIIEIEKLGHHILSD